MTKAELRACVKGLPPVAPHLSARVTEHMFLWLSKRLPGTITLFRPLADEVDLPDLVGRLPGWRWILPRIEPDGRLTWRDARVPLETHRWGMEQPIETGPAIDAAHVDVFLVPGLAFDLAGNRLGRGGGFYDRELVKRRADSVAVGVTVAERIVPIVPTEPHDMRVDYIATEEGVKETIPTR